MYHTLSHLQLCATPRTAARQALLSMQFSKQEVGVGCHFFLQRSSPPRDQNRSSCVSCTGKRILYHCITREALHTVWYPFNTYICYLRAVLNKLYFTTFKPDFIVMKSKLCIMVYHVQSFGLTNNEIFL